MTRFWSICGIRIDIHVFYSVLRRLLHSEQDPNGIYRTDLSQTSVARATDEAIGNRCERCGHIWINIHRPEPDDISQTKSADVAEKSFTLLAQKAARDELIIIRGAL